MAAPMWTTHWAMSRMAREFFGGMGKAYGTGLSVLFEPKVAEAAFNTFVAEPRLPVAYVP